MNRSDHARLSGHFAPVPAHDHSQMEPSAHVATGSATAGEINETVILRMAAGAHVAPEPTIRRIRKGAGIECWFATRFDQAAQLVKLGDAPGAVGGCETVDQRLRFGPGQWRSVTRTASIGRPLAVTAAHPDKPRLRIPHQVRARETEPVICCGCAKGQQQAQSNQRSA